MENTAVPVTPLLASQRPRSSAPPGKVPPCCPKAPRCCRTKSWPRSTPSPLKSLTATETGLLPTSKSPRAMKDTLRLGLHRRWGLHSPQRQHYANDRPCLESWFVNRPAPATPRSFSACCRTASDSVSCAAMRKPVRPGAESQKVRAWRSLSSGARLLAGPPARRGSQVNGRYL